MRTLKILPLLAAAVLASLALVGPATASATEWKYQSEPIAEEQIEFEGHFSFGTVFGGVWCEVSGEATLSNPDQGEITSFDLGPGGSGCQGTGAFYSGCQVESSEAELPMPLHLDGTLVKIEGFDVQVDFVTCSPDVHLVADEDLTATPDDPNGISSLVLAGPVTQIIPGVGELSNVVTGSLDITPAEKYEIG